MSSTKPVFNTKEEALKIARNYYKDDIPKSVTEYQANYPKGLSRNVIKSKLDMTVTQFLKELNPEHIKSNEGVTTEKIQHFSTVLGFKLLNWEGTNSNNIKVTLECIYCGRIQTKSYKSLANCVKGCIYCQAKNVPLKHNNDRISKALERVDAQLISSLPDNQLGEIILKCNSCKTCYSTQLVGLVSPNSTNRATCPNCRTTDYRVTYEGITFGSEFEKNCYIKILEFNIADILLQVKYSNLGDTKRRWTCDFLLDNCIVLEVSTFKSDYKNYKTNLEEKRRFIEMNTPYEFKFCSSIKDLEEFLTSRYSLNI